MTSPFLAPGRWIADQRGEGRGVRVSSHVEGGFLVLSTWKEDTVVATVRLLPDEAAALVAGVADGLSRLTERAPESDLARRLAAMETRLVALEGDVAATSELIGGADTDVMEQEASTTSATPSHRYTRTVRTLGTSPRRSSPCAQASYCVARRGSGSS